MSIPDEKLVIQVNWDDTESSTAWDQTHANILLGQVKQVQVQRNAFHSAVKAETCTIQATDVGYLMRPLKESSPLWPNVRLHRRVRVLRRLPTDGFQAVFFGYLTNIQADPVASSPPRVTLTAESALAVLARRKIAMPTVVDGEVWRSTVGSSNAGTGILATLMTQLSLIGSAFLNFDDVGHQKIPGTYGGGTLTVGEVLAQCCAATGCALSCEPQVQGAPGEPNFVLRWTRSLGEGTPAVTWDSRAGTLEGSPTLTIDYNAERAA
jgi:hypothetical protein